MQILQVTLWLYATALKRSLECVSKNWVVSFAPVVYGIGLSVVGTLVAPFGMIGGLLYSLASAGCASSALFLIKNMVESGKTDVRDFLNGFTVYIWEVITIGFILWIPTWALATSLASLPNGALIFFEAQLGSVTLSTHPQKAHGDNHWRSPVWWFEAARRLQPGDAFAFRYQCFFNQQGATLSLTDPAPCS